MWKSPSISQGFWWSFDRQVLEGLGVGAEETAASSLPSKEGLPAQQPRQMWLCIFVPFARSFLVLLLQRLVVSYKESWEHFLAVPARFSSLSSKIFRALAMCISQQSSLRLDNLKPSMQWALTLSRLESSTHSTLHGLCKWKCLLFIIAKVSLCNTLEVTEPHHIQTSRMLEILEMFTVKHLLKVKLICRIELGYNYWKSVLNKTSCYQIWELQQISPVCWPVCTLTSIGTGLCFLYLFSKKIKIM